MPICFRGAPAKYGIPVTLVKYERLWFTRVTDYAHTFSGVQPMVRVCHTREI